MPLYTPVIAEMWKHQPNLLVDVSLMLLCIGIGVYIGDMLKKLQYKIISYLFVIVAQSGLGLLTLKLCQQEVLSASWEEVSSPLGFQLSNSGASTGPVHDPWNLGAI